jgi:hypothetical protein
MFKKSHFFMSLFLGVFIILAFTACPTSTGGDTTPNTTPDSPSGVTPSLPNLPKPKELDVTSGDVDTSDINNVLTSSSTSSVTLKSDSTQTVQLDDKLEVPAGKTLVIGENITLEIPTDKEAEIKGAVTVQENAVLDLSTVPDDKVALTGTITVESGAEFKILNSTDNNSAIDYQNNGKLVLKDGSKAYLVNGITPVLYIGPESEDASFEWPSGGGSQTTIEFNAVNGVNMITLKGGTITAPKTAYINAAIIDPGAVLEIGSGASALYIRISLEINGTLKSDKSIVGLVDATITFGDQATPNGSALGSDDNFYANGSTSKEAPTAGKSYTWKADAGGSGIAGWKADS